MNASVFDYLSGNVPSGIWGLMIAVLISWFIVWYVYHFSGIMARKRFLSLGSIITSLLLLFYLAFWLRFPVAKNKSRILLTFAAPPTISESFANLYTTNFYIYQLLCDNLDPGHFLIYNPDWPLQIGMWDEYADEAFQKNLATFMNADYILTLKSSNAEGKINGSLSMISSGEPVIALNFSPTTRGIETFVAEVLKKIASKPTLQQSQSACFENWDQEFLFWKRWSRGRLSYLKGDLNQAKTIFSECLRQLPQFPAAILGMAQIELDSARVLKKNGGFFQDHLSLANSYLLHLQKTGVLTAEAFRVWGEYAILFENFVLAEEKLKRSYQLNPNDDQLYVDFTRLHPSRYRDLKFLGEEQLFKQALFINPVSVPARVWYGDYLFRKNELSAALKLYQNFLEKFPRQFDLQIALGKLYITEQKYDEARTLFTRMALNFPQEAGKIRFNLGVAVFHSGDTLAAKSIFEEIADKKLNPDVYLYLAQIAEYQGDIDLAISYLRRRIRENRGLDDPFKEEARKHLVVLLRKKAEGKK